MKQLVIILLVIGIIAPVINTNVQMITIVLRDMFVQEKSVSKNKPSSQANVIGAENLNTFAMQRVLFKGRNLLCVTSAPEELER